MYNITTENVIRNIPTINGIDKERLPQLLTQKYARIISLKTRYETGVIQFNNEELNPSLILKNIFNNFSRDSCC